MTVQLKQDACQDVNSLCREEKGRKLDFHKKIQVRVTGLYNRLEDIQLLTGSLKGYAIIPCQKLLILTIKNSKS